MIPGFEPVSKLLQLKWQSKLTFPLYFIFLLPIAFTSGASTFRCPNLYLFFCPKFPSLRLFSFFLSFSLFLSLSFFLSLVLFLCLFPFVQRDVIFCVHSSSHFEVSCFLVSSDSKNGGILKHFS